MHATGASRGGLRNLNGFPLAAGANARDSGDLHVNAELLVGLGLVGLLAEVVECLVPAAGRGSDVRPSPSRKVPGRPPAHEGALGLQAVSFQIGAGGKPASAQFSESG